MLNIIPTAKHKEVIVHVKHVQILSMHGQMFSILISTDLSLLHDNILMFIFTGCSTAFVLCTTALFSLMYNLTLP